MNQEPPIELGGEALEAYVLHRIALAREEWEAEREAEDQARAAVLRQAAAHGRNDPAWTERRDAAAAVREQRNQGIRAGRTRAARERGIK